MDITQVAKEIRAILKTSFPKTKFSVKSSRFSMGSSVDTWWMDGPTTAQVDELIGQYGDSRSRFIRTSRTHSHELVTQAIAVWKKQNPEYAHFTVTCQGESSCYAEFNMSEFNGGICDLRECESSFHYFLYHAAFDGTNLVLPQENADDCESETVSTPEPESIQIAEVVAEATPEAQPQPSHVDLSKADALEVERKKVYAEYITSWQKADALETRLTVKRKEAQAFHAKMKEIDEQIEAKKREAEVTATPKVQPAFDVKALEAQKLR